MPVYVWACDNCVYQYRTTRKLNAVTHRCKPRSQKISPLRMIRKEERDGRA